MPDQRIGSYRILKPLGTGGMSSVFRAVHVETDHEVALKVLTRSLARNSTLLQRFCGRLAAPKRSSIRTSSRSTIEGSIRAGITWSWSTSRGGFSRLHPAARARSALAEAISVVKSVAGGLRYAAGRGVIHRDIKPSNILRTPPGRSRSSTWGWLFRTNSRMNESRAKGQRSARLITWRPSRRGTAGRPAFRAIMYSLGCTFYYFLTGVAAFPGGDITDKLTRHARSPAPDVRDLRPDIPTAVTADHPEDDGQASRRIDSHRMTI